MKIIVPDFSPDMDSEELRRQLNRFVQDLETIINGKVDFDKNINCQIVDVGFAAANTDTAVAHTLGRPVRGYILVKSNVDASIYDGTPTNSAQFINLKSSAIANVSILLF